MAVGHNMGYFEEFFLKPKIKSMITNF